MGIVTLLNGILLMLLVFANALGANDAVIQARRAAFTQEQVVMEGNQGIIAYRVMTPSIFLASMSLSIFALVNNWDEPCKDLEGFICGYAKVLLWFYLVNWCLIGIIPCCALTSLLLSSAMTGEPPLSFFDDGQHQRHKGGGGHPRRLPPEWV
eukprot:3936774-Rhodomonas_salina.2